MKFPMIWETPNNSDKAIGSLGHVTNYIDFIGVANVSRKWIAYPGLGKRIGNTDAYSGCIGLLQSGQADTMFFLVDYPSDIENVTQGHVIFDEPIGYMGAFPWAKFKPFTFEEQFASFDLATWMTILSFIVFLRLFIAVKLRMMRRFYPRRIRRIRRSDYTYRVLAHFAGTGEIESNTVTMKTTWMVLSLFSFFMFATFDGLMGTGLVMSQPPLIFENYDDLIKYNVKPTFGKQVTAHYAFANAKPGTPEHKLWTWATKQFTEDDMIVDLDPHKSSKPLIEAANHESVFFSLRTLMQLLRANLCRLLGHGTKFTTILNLSNETRGLEKIKDTHFQIYFRYPASLKSQMKQMIYSNTALNKKHLSSGLKNLVEHGFILSERAKLTGFSIISSLIDEKTFFGGKEMDHRTQRACMESNPVDEERSADEMSVVTLSSLQTCIQIFWALLCILSVFAIYGWFKAKMHRQHRNKRVACLTKLREQCKSRPKTC